MNMGRLYRNCWLLVLILAACAAEWTRPRFSLGDETVRIRHVEVDPSKASANLVHTWSLAFECAHALYVEDGRRLAVTDGMTLSLIDAATEKVVYERESKLRTRWHGRMAYSRTADLIAIGHLGAVTVWNARTGELLHTLPAGKSKVYDVAFSPDGAHLAACLSEKEAGVVIWDSRTGKEMQKVPIEGRYAWSLAWSPDGRLAWSQGRYSRGGEGGAHGDVPGEVRIWDVKESRLIRDFKADRYAVWTIAFSPDGKRLASSGGLQYGRRIGDGDVFESRGEGEAIVWDVASGMKLRTLVLPACVFRVAFSPDGRWLAAAGGTSFGTKGDGMVKLFGQDGDDVLTLEHKGSVFGVRFSPDGGRLVTASASDKQVRAWDVAEAKNPDD